MRFKQTSLRQQQQQGINRGRKKESKRQFKTTMRGKNTDCNKPGRLLIINETNYKKAYVKESKQG